MNSVSFVCNSYCGQVQQGKMSGCFFGMFGWLREHWSIVLLIDCPEWCLIVCGRVFPVWEAELRSSSQTQTCPPVKPLPWSADRGASSTPTGPPEPRSTRSVTGANYRDNETTTGAFYYAASNVLDFYARINMFFYTVLAYNAWKKLKREHLY